MTELVVRAIPLLEFEQFRVDVEERERVIEIRLLASEQVADDLNHVDPRKNHHVHVVSVGWGPETDGPSNTTHDWSPWNVTPSQFWAADVIDECLTECLTEDQRVLVRWHYWGWESHEAIGRRLGISHQAVTQRFKTIHRRLRHGLPEEVRP